MSDARPTDMQLTREKKIYTMIKVTTKDEHCIIKF